MCGGERHVLPLVCTRVCALTHPDACACAHPAAPAHPRAHAHCNGATKGTPRLLHRIHCIVYPGGALETPTLCAAPPEAAAHSRNDDIVISRQIMSATGSTSCAVCRGAGGLVARRMSAVVTLRVLQSAAQWV